MKSSFKMAALVASLGFVGVASAQLTKTQISDSIIGENGYTYTGLASVTESYVSSDTFNNNGGSGYRFAGVMDGMGAFEKDANTVRVIMNHEVGSFPGPANSWTTGDGALTLSGGRISYIDIDKNTFKIKDSGIAINSFVDGSGAAITSESQFDNGTGYGTRDANGFAPVVPGLGSLDRPCSANFFGAHSFGNNQGFANNIFLFGEEQTSRFGGYGGQMWALDTTTGVTYEAPALGRGAWENGTLIDTGSTDTVAILLSDDHSWSSSDATGSVAPSAVLWVGEKNAGTGGFLDQNGLETGKLYSWAPSAVADARDLGNLAGTGTSLSGSWVELTNSGLAPDGTATDAQLRAEARADGAQIFSRPEDVHTNPNNGQEAFMITTGRRINEDGSGDDLADQEGSLFVFDFSSTFGSDGLVSGTTSVTNVYDADTDNFLDLGDNQDLDNPDNGVWSADGNIYVQEDGDADAGIYQIDPATGSLLRIARADVASITDGGGTPFLMDSSTPESSGIIDVSELFGFQPGELFLADTQNHNIDDSGELDVNLLGYNPEEFAQVGFIAADGIAVPEPTSLALLGLGGLLIARRRRG